MGYEISCRIQSGLYFLYRDDKLVYIGKSKNVLSRVMQHKNEFAYDKAVVFPLKEALLHDAEICFIQLFSPEHNAQRNYAFIARIPFEAKLNSVIDGFDEFWGNPGCTFTGSLLPCVYNRIKEKWGDAIRIIGDPEPNDSPTEEEIANQIISIALLFGYFPRPVETHYL